jgi:outer membrane receptor for ferrienterochelin and colicins
MSNNRTLLLLSFLAFTYTSAIAQTISGRVVDKATNEPIVNATVLVLPEKKGATTDEKGNFRILLNGKADRQLMISHVNYSADTVVLGKNNYLEIKLVVLGKLKDVIINVTQKSTYVDQGSTIKTEIITAMALTKAACCNLSESFGTSTTIDITNRDAVTGSKEILMFGLDGNYVQINTENIPNIRGLNSVYGLSYIPGTWIKTISIGKGAGSVVNGYESMIGQINVELQKPHLSEKYFVNSYYNSMGRFELNVHTAKRFNKKWTTGILFHFSDMNEKDDANDDGFYDGPSTRQFNILNRWNYDDEKLKLNFGIRAVFDNRTGGESMGEKVVLVDSLYKYKAKVERWEWFLKVGRLYSTKPYKSMGFITNISFHNQKSFFGLKQYDGKQVGFYSNYIYQNAINGNPNQQFKLGGSLLIDDFDEFLSDSVMNDFKKNYILSRKEFVQGAYAEYTYKDKKNFTGVAGARLDYNNLYGAFFTPRFHLNYSFNAKSSIRLSAGKGYRVPNAVAENTTMLLSSRKVSFIEGFLPEISWSYGVSYNKSFSIFSKSANVNIDIFRNNFKNQLIVDRDADYSEIRFYNLNGKSYSTSFQIQVDYTPISNFNVSLGYKWNDVKTTINSMLVDQPFVSKNKSLVSFSYATKGSKWTFDCSLQSIGWQRTVNSSQPYTQLRPDRSPSYLLINAHINKKLGRKIELYLGGENLTNYKQKKPIVSPENPFSKNFDASLIWGPISGRSFYGGFRFKTF